MNQQRINELFPNLNFIVVKALLANGTEIDATLCNTFTLYAGLIPRWCNAKNLEPILSNVLKWRYLNPQEAEAYGEIEKYHAVHSNIDWQS